ncbi:hypothetical protein BJY17_002808 [Agromyces hippuratus]|uniref:Uncharacterized protein n=1 Tax=Agromyces hippuratus TaxID=286438 RepID=A0A852X7X7_9MICO|nr:hypothetical protein [Agromyces hippuratus]NYG22061.1 hypothetical protein [Agromyces hippuratus]
MADSAQSAGGAGRPEKQGWGVIPGPVHRLLVRLTEKARAIADGQDVSEWPPADTPSDFDPYFRKTLAATQALHETTTDLRSLVSAWAHKYHQPKPNFSDLARAQGATPQGLYKRYKQSTRDAIDELLSDEPQIAVILDAFPSLRLVDLRGLSTPIDRALRDAHARITSASASSPYEDRLAHVLEVLEAVAAVNGLKPDMQQVHDLLVEVDIEPTDENIASIREGLLNGTSQS